MSGRLRGAVSLHIASRERRSPCRLLSEGVAEELVRRRGTVALHRARKPMLRA